MPNLKQVLEQLLQDIINKVPKSVSPESVDIKIDLNSIILSLNLDIKGYSIIYGSRGHMPPVSAIKAWVEQKHIEPRVNEKGKLPSIDGLSWAIAKTIEKRGTPPHDYYDKSVNELLTVYEPIICEAFSSDLIASFQLETLV